MTDTVIMNRDAKSEIRSKFFDLLYGANEGYLCIATSDPVAPKARFQQKFFEWPKESVRVENYILQVERKHNVYFCVNLLEKMERKKENCLPTDLVWADLDEVNPESIVRIPPPIFWESSPARWQAIWRMSTPVPPFQAEEYSRRIAYLIGADKSGWDLGQLLRVPFTHNFKYQPPALIELRRALETTAKPLLFEAIPSTIEAPGEPMPEQDVDLNLDAVLYKYRPLLNKTYFGALFTQEPDDDWSSILWRLLHVCFKVGMTAEEVFVVAHEAKCNKYARDGRPIEHLWRDVLKAGEAHHKTAGDEVLLQMPVLVEEPYSRTFVDEYREWADEVTDAVPDFHNLCLFVGMSALVSASVRLETSFGTIVPNLWGLIMGDSTLTRKTTAMRMVTDFLVNMDHELLAANEGTSEGLLQALSERPNKASIFFKDEVSMLFDGMSRKDYMAGMQETLTALYDSPPYYKKKLANRSITIEQPSFIFLAGGVTDRIYASVSESFVLSGFLPRFLISLGEEDEDRYRTLGPPTDRGTSLRPAIFHKFADIFEVYSSEVETKIAGQKVLMPPRYIAKLTPEAWAKNGEYERKLNKAAKSSPIRGLALPTFERLSRSIVKMAVVLACMRQKPVQGIVTVEEGDIINAAWYAQKWGEDAIILMVNAGKGTHEKFLDKVCEFIEENPGVLRSVIMRRFHLDSKVMTAVIITLEERGMIRKERRGAGFAFWTE